tara:strand:- start:426 stop:593 length:168 start_codon:yes stop_codon:yes gene_type:complete
LYGFAEEYDNDVSGRVDAPFWDKVLSIAFAHAEDADEGDYGPARHGPRFNGRGSV